MHLDLVYEHLVLGVNPFQVFNPPELHGLEELDSVVDELFSF